MRIQPPREKANIVAPLFVALLVLTALAAGLITLLYSQKPANVPAFEVQSFAGKTEISQDSQAWVVPARGESLKVNGWARTGADGEMDLLFGKSTFIRVKENTQFQIEPPQIFSKAEARLHLEKGTVLIATENDTVQVSVPGTNYKGENQGFFYDLAAKFFATSQGGTFLVSSSPETGKAQVSVLQGEVNIQPGIPLTTTPVKALEMLQAEGQNSQKSPLSEKEWGNVREAYEIQPRSAVNEAAQLDLSKRSGDFFGYVFDHGTFYQDKWGWCMREFIAPEEVNEPTYLETNYDVFPKGSWVGLYFKTRDLDLSKFKGFRLEVKKAPGKDSPDAVRVEFKSRYQIVRAFAIKMVKEKWETADFNFQFSKETPISEVTFIFSNDKVGAHKTGGIQMRNFSLIPADVKPAEPAAAPAPAVEPVKAAVPVAEPAAPAPAASEEAGEAELEEPADAAPAQ